MKKKKKVLDPKAKAKRQKIILIGASVLFVGLLAIQGPKTLKMLHRKPPASAGPATPANAPAAATPGAVPGGLSSSGAVPGTLVESDPPPVPQPGQLVSFNRFASKDPFVQQVHDASASPVTGAAPGTLAPAPAVTPGVPLPTPTPPVSKAPAPSGVTSPGTSSAPGTATPPATTPSSTTPAPTSTGPTQTAPPAPTTAVIAVNGIRETVETAKDFPSDNPIFHLVAVTKSGAKIGIVGGSYASGAATIMLEVGKTVTLQNTADGTRYDIRLISVG